MMEIVAVALGAFCFAMGYALRACAPPIARSRELPPATARQIDRARRANQLRPARDVDGEAR